MSKVKVKLVKSSIDYPERQRRTLRALGLNKVDSSNELELTPQVEGMIKKVAHLVTVVKEKA